MKRTVIVGTVNAAAWWCRENGVSPHSVIRVFEPRDEQKLRGLRWDDVELVHLEQPHWAITQTLTWLAAKSGKQRGRFVVFEGGEGAGKSTQVRLLAAEMRQPGREVVVTQEPGATQLGRTIRGLLLNRDAPDPPSARAEALLYAADRAHHVATVIRPALLRGALVISDRYVDSSLAYQGVGRGRDAEQVRMLSAYATDGLVPDLTVLLDLPSDLGLERARRRGAADRVEARPAGFHEQVRLRFRELARAEPARYLVLDATQTVSEVAVDVRQAVERLLEEKRRVNVAV